MLQNYLACGNESVSVDFFGLNSYEWYVLFAQSQWAISFGLTMKDYIEANGCTGAAMLPTKLQVMQIYRQCPPGTTFQSFSPRLDVMLFNPELSPIKQQYSALT